MVLHGLDVVVCDIASAILQHSEVVVKEGLVTEPLASIGNTGVSLSHAFVVCALLVFDELLKRTMLKIFGLAIAMITPSAAHIGHTLTTLPK